MGLSEEDLEQVKNLVNTSLNGVAANLKKQFTTDRTKDNETLAASLAKVIDDKLTAVRAEFSPTEPSEGGKGGKGGKEGNSQELASLKRLVQDLQKETTESKQAMALERSKNREVSMRQAVAEALEPHGITGSRFRAAYALLKSDGRIQFAADDSDDLVFVDGSDQLPVDQGLGSWVKGEDAKIYLPPSGVGGSGSRPTATKPKIGPASTPQERQAAMSTALNSWAENR
jgi:hypothetical protein